MKMTCVLSRLFLIVLLFGALLACDPPAPPPEPVPEVEEAPIATMTPHEAARRGRIDQLELLFSEGEDVDVRDDFGSTPLHEAASAGEGDAIDWLLMRGADLHARDESGFEAIQLASFMAHDDVVSMLIGYGAELEEFEEDIIEEEEWEEPDLDELVDLEEEPEEIELPDGWEDMDFRMWRSADGQEVEAAFLDLVSDVVTLGTPDGRTARIAINRLSRDDQIEARRLGSAGVPGSRPTMDTRPVNVQSGFGGECERILIRAIQGARQEVLVAIYTLTRPQIEQALSRAAQRGVTVKVKYDAKQLPVSRMEELITRMEQRGVAVVPIEMRGRFASMHHKFAIVDGASVFTGSFNFTITAATQSYENCVLIDSVQVARDFEREFSRIRGR